ncbi:MAG: prepilin-type N-terminal cleavage/methylation domain-containing protein [Clostridium sp.]|uniref:pilus assembly FimT family protein n=1 Tax=Clostridium sp. TaxID=1506 RepID=UPI001EB0D4CA|nr:prepilin-type N-terminal cleavage/methylation domain-containing protein [Clostridium sp.]MBS5886162.1 prepilin-type N-terminal cleavage/methylation domain-containing protein [Clostridium sp.]MDU7147675.1 prepilin-type N-terminal cleavage/methylation domain-containing protein [Clostridium sp.]MDU7241566.1 prepilin-type N-terminal cleavage/methylation domain-containing protein [Clostridium sp.]
MRKKTKGFTVLELIITLSLTVVVLGVVYTFFFSNSKTLAKTEINSDLQLESETIQKELLLYGAQAEGISKLNNVTIKDTNKCNYEGLLDDNGKLDVTELKFKIGAEYFTFIYDIGINKLTLKKVNKDGEEVIDSKLDFPKILSSNITEFKVRPLDYRMNPKGNFKETTGLEISLVLNKKKGYSDVTMPVSVIVKFRNK